MQTTKDQLLPLELAERKVSRERDRQIKKFDHQTHTPLKWMAIILEELGEFANAYLEHDIEGPGGNGPDHAEIDAHMLEEWVQVTAVGMAGIQDMTVQLQKNYVA